MTKTNTSEDLWTPLIPRESLFWNRIPLFHVSHFRKNFTGRLYFVLGQGLGDHLNGFRILHEIMGRFPKAKYIVYADRRWEELVERIKGIEIRWYPKAKDVLSKEGTNNPYDPAHEEICREINAANGESFLAYAHFPMPDRHARRETTLEATARTIGLDLAERARPYLPVLDEDLNWAEDFLKRHDLEKNGYVVISPYSWPNKIWGKKNFSHLIDALWEGFGLRTIVVSYPEIGKFENFGTVCAFDLTLGQIAGLMNFARLYVGLDSGPSHMAAAFDLPMVAIFIEKRTIPFEVRPLSPKCLNVVESFFSSLDFPRIETVVESVSRILQCHQNPLYDCPVCGGTINNVLTSEKGLLRLMCNCGFTIDTPSNSSASLEIPGIQQRNKNIDDSSIEINPYFHNLKEFLTLDKTIGSYIPKKIIATVLKNKSDGNPSLSKIISGRISLSLDAIMIWMNRKEYHLLSLISLKDKFVLEFGKTKPLKKIRMRIPWGRGILDTNEDQYLRWYSFERWGNPEHLVGIVKSQAELGIGRDEMPYCAWTAFKAEPTFRSFRWVLKAFFFRVIQSH